MAKAQLTYSVNDDNTITITGYNGTPGNLIIPSTITVITGYDTNNLPIYTAMPVTSISSLAFAQLPNPYGGIAFLNPPDLTSVVIPDSVTSIGDDAFSGNFYLTNAVIGNNVTTIGRGAFGGCSSLASVTIGNRVTSIGDSVFFGDGSLGNVTIPNSVTNIATGAFTSCGRLTSVVIPDSVTSIGEGAFESCYNLTNVVISTNLTNLGETYDSETGDGEVFAGCTSLTSVIIPNSVSSILHDTFGGCTNLASVTLSTNLTSIHDYAFYDCTGLTNITIPGSVTNIGEYAFAVDPGYVGHLTSAYFQGYAPTVDDFSSAYWGTYAPTVYGGNLDTTVFSQQSGTVYYLAGTSGWGSTFGGWPTVPIGIQHGIQLAHRYIFNETNGSTTVVDSVGGAAWNGTLPNGGTFANGQLSFSSASQQYLNLPGGVVSNNFLATTIEMWIPRISGTTTSPPYVYLFSFGNTDGNGAGYDYIFFNPNLARTTISTADPGWEDEQGGNLPSSLGTATNLHLTCVFDGPNGAISVYTNGVLASAFTNITDSLALVGNEYSYIGRSLYTSDAYLDSLPSGYKSNNSNWLGESTVSVWFCVFISNSATGICKNAFTLKTCRIWDRLRCRRNSFLKIATRV